MSFFEKATKAIKGEPKYEPNGHPVILHHLRLDQSPERTEHLLSMYARSHPTAYVDPTLGQWGAIAYFPHKENKSK